MAHVPAAVRRKQIIEAATAVIAREGVAGASTRAIAREAAVPLATLHYVFATKDDVVAGVLEMLLDKAKLSIDQCVQRVLVASPDATRDLAQIVDQLVHAYWDDMQQDLGSQRVQYELTLHALRAPQAGNVGRALYEYYLDATEGLIRDVCERTGETVHASVRDIAHLIVSGIDGILLQSLIVADHDQARRSLDNLVGAVLATATRPHG
ncbi:TetR/AcrR family transcriptional regulator [Lentzea sp. PSKA42]|uniref:TetR/AcrR family transcriptional regulator n=1 Tax=Lentzea indica TaxID=2604800 RepID=A0ABX1FK76_9PSEU|nr:TetR/AcrR family transcriptional regulator [Lentzea indica]NKE58987.1 TetR/AcrR family transcriptional regulator [Lentzea indica]